MGKEFLYALADAAAGYDVVEKIGTFSGEVQKVLHGGKIIEGQLRLKEKSMETQLEYEIRRMEHEELNSLLKSKNYIETLKAFTEIRKERELSEAESNIIWSALYNVNNELR